MQSSRRKVKIQRGKYYLKQGELVKALSVNMKENRVIIFKYNSFEKEHIEYDTAHFQLTPVFKIGEVAKMLNRSPDTLRKYEKLDYISPASQYRMTEDGNGTMRFYTEQDIDELVVFFANRNLPGARKKTNSKINTIDVNTHIKSRFKE